MKVAPSPAIPAPLPLRRGRDARRMVSGKLRNLGKPEAVPALSFCIQGYPLEHTLKEICKAHHGLISAKRLAVRNAAKRPSLLAPSKGRKFEDTQKTCRPAVPAILPPAVANAAGGSTSSDQDETCRVPADSTRNKSGRVNQ